MMALVIIEKRPRKYIRNKFVYLCLWLTVRPAVACYHELGPGIRSRFYAVFARYCYVSVLL